MLNRAEIPTHVAETDPQRFYEEKLAPVGSNRNSLVLILMGLGGKIVSEYAQSPMGWAAEEFRKAGLTSSRVLGTQHYYYNCEDRDFTVWGKHLNPKGMELVPLAGALLDFSKRNQMEIEELLRDGGFQLRKPNATTKRIDLIRNLQQLDSLGKVSDIDTEANPNNYASDLFRLGNAGLATIDVVDIKKGAPGNSIVTVSDEQRALTTDFLSIIDGFVDGNMDIVEKGRVSAREFLQNPTLASIPHPRGDGTFYTPNLLEPSRY